MAKASLSLPYRLMGFAGEPKVSPIFKMLFVNDRRALRSKLAELAELAELAGDARVVPCHGDIVSSEASEALRLASVGL